MAERMTKKVHDAEHTDALAEGCRWCLEREAAAIAAESPDLVGGSVIDGYEPAFPLSELRGFHKNPRRGDIALIAESIERNGQYRPLVVNRGTKTGRLNEILAGNHTYAALQHLGRLTAAVTFVDVDDQQAARIVIVDNRASDKAKTDEDVLKDLAADLDDLAGTGITDAEFAKMAGLGDDGDGPDTDPQLGDVGYAIIVTCDDEDHQAALLESFEGEGLDARPLMM